jgi:sigma-B regulation protein RsbU (phosphoserine phosphatase)
MPKNQSDTDFEADFRRKELQLKDILDITQAININSSEESLYFMYKLTLQGSLNVGKLALYVLDERWQCKVSFGTEHKPVVLENAALEGVLEQAFVENLTFEKDFFREFDVVIPVLHKDEILAYTFLDKYEQQAGEEAKEIDTGFVQALTNIIIVAIQNKKLARQQLKQAGQKKEMEIAQRVQSLLFPKHLPQSAELKIKATYYPQDLIGGDYYDYIPLAEGKFLICVADVSGKGIPAALLMSNVQATLRVLVRQTHNLKTIVEELNLLIFENAEGEHFITFFMAIYDRKSQSLTYINAGHNPPFFYNFNTHLSHLLENGTTVLGAFVPLPFIEETTLQNVNNALIFGYTDGITESNNPEEEQFGIDRLVKFLRQHPKTDLAELHGNLISKINYFRKEVPFTDDITLLSCRIHLGAH